ncbi:MAG: hypothetical protein K0A89_07840 [ANME-2 cluster archaeon]|nr:hypothetical protein [ANME-2 cluster archaeon]
MNTHNDWLRAVEAMGKILIFTPLIVALVSWISIFLAGSSPKIDYSGAFLMFQAGFITIIYASIKRFQEGMRSVK